MFSGSACSSGRLEPSPVLQEMGLDEQEAYSSIRFSLSILNTEEEMEEAATIIAGLVKGEI